MKIETYLAKDIMKAIGAKVVGEIQGCPLYTCDQMPEGTMYAFSPTTEITLEQPDPPWWPGEDVKRRVP